MAKNSALNLEVTPGGTGTWSYPGTTDTITNAGILWTTNSADNTVSYNAGGVQPIFESARDRLTVDGSMTYLFKMFVQGTNGTTTCLKGFSFDGGTCTFTSILWDMIGQHVASGSTGTTQSTAHGAVATVINTLATGTTSWWVKYEGIMRINAGGTLLPQFRYSADPTTSYVIKKDSYMYLIPLGSNTTYSGGAWA